MNISSFKHWWLVALKGLAITILGLIIQQFPVESTEYIVLVITFLIGVGGTFVISFAYYNPNKYLRVWYALLGVFEIIIAFVLYFYPDVTIEIIFVLLGYWLLINGVQELYLSYRSRLLSQNYRLPFLNGALGVIFGSLFIIFPTSAISSFGYVMGVTTCIFGIFLTVTALRWAWHERKVKA